MATGKPLGRRMHCTTCLDDIQPGTIYRPVKNTVSCATCEKCLGEKQKRATDLMGGLDDLDIIEIELLAEMITEADEDEDAAREDAFSLNRYQKVNALLDALADLGFERGKMEW